MFDEVGELSHKCCSQIAFAIDSEDQKIQTSSIIEFMRLTKQIIGGEFIFRQSFEALLALERSAEKVDFVWYLSWRGAIKM